MEKDPVPPQPSSLGSGPWNGAITHPGMFNAKNLNPLVETFIAENEARQKEQERSVDAKEFWVNYQLLGQAAARNDSVFNEALVTPSRTGSAVAGSPPSAST